MINRNVELTQKRLKEVLDYNPDTGIFIWKLARQGMIIGDIAGYKENYGYIRIRIDGKPYLAHRLAWLFVYGYLPKDNLDHIDRIRDNNWIKNLRKVTQSKNMMNSKARINNTSGVKGVHYYKQIQKWCAYITILRKRIHLGYHENKLDAAKARYEAEIEHGYTDVSSMISDAQLYILRYEPEKDLIEYCVKSIDDIMNS